MDQSSSGAARAPAAISVEVIRLVSLAAVERAAAEWVATHPTVRIIRQTAPFAVGDHPDLINSGVWEIRIEYEEDGRRPAALFDRAALALFGEQYRAPLARALRLKRADTVDDWRTGRANVPKGVWNDMIALLAGRRSEMPDLLDDLRIQADLRKDSAFYEAAMIQDLMRECGDAEGKYVRLRLKYITRTFRTPKGQEFALHGYCRRMGLMVHCLENVYRSLPPDMTAVPLDEQVLDCTVNLQAFLINVFGALDNLAWVLVFEKNI